MSYGAGSVEPLGGVSPRHDLDRTSLRGRKQSTKAGH
jgi:hypothetical protein